MLQHLDTLAAVILLLLKFHHLCKYKSVSDLLGQVQLQIKSTFLLQIKVIKLQFQIQVLIQVPGILHSME